MVIRGAVRRKRRAPILGQAHSLRGMMPAFPDTHLSVVQALGGADPELRARAAELVARTYRGPLLALLRWRWHLEPADAEDLVQEFLATALHKDWLVRFDPARGRFRTFLRVAADRFAANQRQAAHRVKRGGGVATVPLDGVAVAGADGDAEAERRFRDEWIRSVFALALERLAGEAEASDRGLHLVLFRAYDLADEPRPTYRELGVAHALGETQVINHLAWARRRFRVHVLAVLRELAGSEAEYRDDVRDLLGIAAP